MIHTPNDLEVLLHYYVSPTPHPRLTASAVQESISRFLTNGILEKSDVWDSGYTVTNRGKAWLEMLLATPYPVYVWADPRDGGIFQLEETFNESARKVQK